MKNNVKNSDGSWFLPFRLATFTVLLILAISRFRDPYLLQFPFITYAILTLFFVLAFAFRAKIKIHRLTGFLIALQFMAELAFESGVIYKTGGVYSPFSALFILTIVSAALWYGLSGTLLVASSASVCYAFIVWFKLAAGGGEFSWSLSQVRDVFSTNETEFYSVLLHLFIFYLVAFISGYLAERFQTQRRQLESTFLALRQARLETDEILRQISSGLLTIDNRGVVVYFNRSAEATLGYAERDIRGIPCRDAFAERMPALAHCLMSGLATGYDHPRRELEVTGIDGRVIPLGLSTSVMTSDDGELKGLIAIFSNLTDAKEMEIKIRAADRLAAVGELSASIAHEIRNPLASISGSVEVLQRELQVEGENERLMDLVVKESHRLSEILTQFLIYARIDRPSYDKVELCHVVNETLQIMRHHGSFHSGIELDFVADESIVYVLGNADMFKQLLLNLFVNGCEALGKPGGELRIQLAMNQNSGNAELYVQDNGPGIPADEIARIFEPFYSSKKSGTGLGLSIVHRIAVSLKLSVSVDSQQGEGTTFLVEFPLYGIPAASNDRHVTSKAVTA